MHVESSVSVKAYNIKQLKNCKHFEESPLLWTYCNNYLITYCLYIQTLFLKYFFSRKMERTLKAEPIGLHDGCHSCDSPLRYATL